jgi:uncharacterized protein
VTQDCQPDSTIALTFNAASMRELIARHKDAIIKYTNLDFDRIQNITYLYEFDREVQCATWGYPTEDAYYRDASSSDAVLAIRIPFLAISAKDDPVSVRFASSCRLKIDSHS